MTFRSFSSILFGMALLGFSIGLVVGIYLQWQTELRIWAYLAVPFMGIGSALAAYGTLSASHQKKSLRETNG
ncbi:MAG: hypothetical protein IID15_05700 [Candidatus Marinimicrobia bacterium]|nr:hypothetical protein [Candidatus Neomarinimicrobiota bacterium]